MTAGLAVPASSPQEFCTAKISYLSFRFVTKSFFDLSPYWISTEFAYALHRDEDPEIFGLPDPVLF